MQPYHEHDGGGCCRGACPDLIEVGVALMRWEIVYDVEFVTNRIARTQAIGEDGSTLKVAEVMSAEGCENADYIDRLIMSAVKRLRARTSWASGERGGRIVSDELPEHTQDWTFVFRVPGAWRGDADVLCSLCHDYVAKQVTYEWLKMTAPRMAPDYGAEAAEALREVVEELRKQAPTTPQLYNLTGWPPPTKKQKCRMK